MPPKLFSFPHFPRPPAPPRLSTLLHGNNPVRQILDDSHELIRGAREEIRSVTQVLHFDHTASTILTSPKQAGEEAKPPPREQKISAVPASSPGALTQTHPRVDGDVVHTEPSRVIGKLWERTLIVGDAKPPTKVEAPAVVSTGVSDAETLQYQLEGLVDELSELETRHLPAGGKILGKSCDCIRKHSGAVRRLAKETIPIAARQGKDTKIYTDMVAWADDVMKIGTKAAVDSGQYKDRYAVESGTASKFRKAVEAGGDCPTCNQPKRLKEFLKDKDA